MLEVPMPSAQDTLSSWQTCIGESQHRKPVGVFGKVLSASPGSQSPFDMHLLVSYPVRKPD